MSKLQDIRDARIEIAKAAARRWRERTSDRRSSAALIHAAGPGAADSPEAVANFERRSRVVAAKAARAMSAPPPRSFLERLIGADDLARAPRTHEEQKAGVPVARIAIINGLGLEPTGFGTGFMIAPQLLMTNNHVLESRGDARGVGANFRYEFEGSAVRAGEIFELDPDEFFITHQRLDFTLVAVKPTSLAGAHLSDYGFHKLIEQTGKLLIGHPVSIIQHPDGGPKRYAVTENEVVDRLADFLHYRTDTKPGSSGSPCFNLLWEVVALHHSGVPRMRGDVILNDFGDPWDASQGDEAIDWVANEGVRISRILAEVRATSIADPGQAALRDTIFTTPAPSEVAPIPPTALAGVAAPLPSPSTLLPAEVGPTVITSTARPISTCSTPPRQRTVDWCRRAPAPSGPI
jgi:endonuclease G, mitochondrial